MAQSNAAVKVGVVMILSLTALGFLAFFFFGRSVGGYPVDVSFQDAQGITEQADVLLAGVKVGSVHKIRLDPSGRHAVLRLNIRPDQNIPLGSTFTISSGGLLGELAVVITPPTVAADGYIPRSSETPPLIQGKDLVTIDQLKEQVAQLGEGSQQVLSNLRIATDNVAKITSDPVLRRALRNTALNTERAAYNAERISDQGLIAAAEVKATIRRLNAFIASEEPVLNATLRNIERAAKKGEPMADEMIETIRSARTLVDDVTATSQFLRDTLNDTLAEADAGPALNRALKNMADASEEFRAVAVNARKISDDLAGTDTDTSKVGALVTRVGAVAEKADVLLEKITGVTERAGKRRGRLIDGAAEVGVFQRLGSDSRFRADVNLAIKRSNDSAIILGLRDIGESNRLNFQNSTPLTDRTRLRYGFHASRLGLGLDWNISGNPVSPLVSDQPGATSLSLDLFDPNDAQIDVFGRYQVSDRLGVVYGVEDLFHHSYPTVGLSYRP